MAGIRMICKAYGGMRVTENGKTTVYVWDYDKDEPVKEEEMKNRERLKKSERAKWLKIKKEMKLTMKKAQEDLSF